MTLGRYGTLMPDEARKRARIQLGEVAAGHDPARERRDKLNRPKVSVLAKDYLNYHANLKKRVSTAREDKRMIDTIIVPRFGNQKVEEISARDIDRLMKKMAATPYQANRVRSLLSKMFVISISWGWRTDNPVKSVMRYNETSRERWLDQKELLRLWAVLAEHPNQKHANIVRLLILTGARVGEVRQARWEQFDLDTGVWTKPSHATKQKRLHHFPLSEATLDLLMEIRRIAKKDAEWVFPGAVAGHPTREIKRFWSEARTLASLPDIRLHDLRHTFASQLVSRGTSLVIVGRLLGHTQPQTTMRYAHLADDPLRVVANEFSALLEPSGTEAAE